MSLNRSQLEHFVAVVEDGQITRAARRLRVSQPTISRSLTQLETDLRTTLLVREPRGVRLTPNGEVFLGKARAVLAAEADASAVAESLSHGKETISVGFVGPPPALSAPELFAAFSSARPGAVVNFRDLSFPSGPTSVWLAGVDVAFCHAPEYDPNVSTHVVRLEPRVLVAHRSHRLATAQSLTVSDVLDETFVSYDDDVQARWAGFHSLDDHRGSPPRRVTAHRALNSLGMLGIMGSGEAVTAVPAIDARLAIMVSSELTAVELVDASPARLSFVWRSSNQNPLIDVLASSSESLDGSADAV